MGSSSSYILLLPSNPKFSSVKFGKSVIRISASSCATTSKSRTTSSSSSSLYDVLGIHSGATSKEIKTAYRRLARLVHPDAATASYGDSGEEFIRIHAAYSTLSDDPVKRADYDDSSSSISHSHRRFSRYYAAKPRRTWETDQCW
ncbi:chaperone protein dnaJ 11, chloroplastic-like [Impatiens glandulifera]|uniref:chaperone protein dnaJ 11, chloroplastic-like n=1 Tax=Impatiens glandulifera TaxID=253017 RepID=UPI001FB056E0|nr:chaperone protein dnaJ 11, chloroplastic-like [Impatiens glandulifera]